MLATGNPIVINTYEYLFSAQPCTNFLTSKTYLHTGTFISFTCIKAALVAYPYSHACQLDSVLITTNKRTRDTAQACAKKYLEIPSPRTTTKHTHLPTTSVSTLICRGKTVFNNTDCFRPSPYTKAGPSTGKVFRSEHYSHQGTNKRIGRQPAHSPAQDPAATRAKH